MASAWKTLFRVLLLLSAVIIANGQRPAIDACPAAAANNHCYLLPTSCTPAGNDCNGKVTVVVEVGPPAVLTYNIIMGGVDNRYVAAGLSNTDKMGPGFGVVCIQFGGLFSHVLRHLIGTGQQAAIVSPDPVVTVEAAAGTCSFNITLPFNIPTITPPVTIDGTSLHFVYSTGEATAGDAINGHGPGANRGFSERIMIGDTSDTSSSEVPPGGSGGGTPTPPPTTTAVGGSGHVHQSWTFVVIPLTLALATVRTMAA